MAAYAMLRDHGKRDEALAIWDIVGLSIPFQLQMHLEPAACLFLPNPARALGGVRESLTGYRVQIDYVQHSMSGLLAAWRVMKQESRPVLAPPGSGARRHLDENWRRVSGS